jgi:hypothetical protein
MNKDIVDMGNALGFHMGDWLSSLANSWSHREVYDPFVSASVIFL